MDRDLATRDYARRVAFPVPIVGVDGEVRRYDYDEAVALYWRRWRNARMPSARERVEEVEHCLNRIDQLRRSYLHDVGWDDGHAVVQRYGSFAAVVAATLRRLRHRPNGDVILLADGQRSTWYVPGEPARILHVWRFREAGAQEDYERDKSLHRSGAGDQEVLLNSFSGPDGAVVLTGRAEDTEELRSADIAGVGPESPLDAVRKLLQEARFVDAFEAVRHHLWRNPGDRRAHLIALMLAVRLQQANVASRLASQATRTFPGDPLVSWFSHRAWRLAGERALATRALRAAVQGDPPAPGAVRMEAAQRLANVPAIWLRRWNVALPDDPYVAAMLVEARAVRVALAVASVALLIALQVWWMVGVAWLVPLVLFAAVVGVVVHRRRSLDWQDLVLDEPLERQIREIFQSDA